MRTKIGVTALFIAFAFSGTLALYYRTMAEEARKDIEAYNEACDDLRFQLSETQEELHECKDAAK